MAIKTLPLTPEDFAINTVLVSPATERAVLEELKRFRRDIPLCWVTYVRWREGMEAGIVELGDNEKLQCFYPVVHGKLIFRTATYCHPDYYTHHGLPAPPGFRGIPPVPEPPTSP